ncbi:BnaC08g45050D [Brassica napus]|uniref:BnaC08g45050D protein n=2 Tax=Brassica TaxID=3705 RepID=A0A078F979_BRANA|nr:BnaC08g45050D [Brassica napus]VDD59391.1 unnamed protein product [Brassica oleracea]
MVMTISSDAACLSKLGSLINLGAKKKGHTVLTVLRGRRRWALGNSNKTVVLPSLLHLLFFATIPLGQEPIATRYSMAF